MSATPITLRATLGSAEYPTLTAIWQSAVEATHSFLTPADIEFYRERIENVYLDAVTLTVAEADGVPLGFSGIAEGSLEMLFVHADARGTGIGGALLTAALTEYPTLVTDVNEQNPDALGFYLTHGFEVAGRSELDGDGRPFPLLHLRRATPGTATP
ncbi:GNAT family N-acetyltransferase [Mycetocola tolaasinivorans]|uniref:GNAT family N-acetyltransferase n=1 Tax=Mycetocola tolaasinivorans TaxID=76635 RepID=A0A3L7A5J1_9MICO|nr:GNAT family N-acetyltransferase [Mycetocola tolaasinivorans]RLP75579.1 GNAT family N-acetyltransferase [Mycetocola tolaasinivorans]